MICAREDPQPFWHPTGPPPSTRVPPSQPSSSTGIDYCGPVYVRSTKRRTSSTKGYIAIFVCFGIKAVHIEMVDDLSPPVLLPHDAGRNIHSNSAKAFIDATSELHRLYQMFRHGLDSELIARIWQQF